MSYYRKFSRRIWREAAALGQFGNDRGIRKAAWRQFYRKVNPGHHGWSHRKDA